MSIYVRLVDLGEEELADDYVDEKSEWSRAYSELETKLFYAQKELRSLKDKIRDEDENGVRYNDIHLHVALDKMGK